MNKRIYISADYSPSDGDTAVVDCLNTWGQDQLRAVEFVDMAKVTSGSISSNPDCRICDLKEEFNHQIKASSIVICVVGHKTAVRTAGSSCPRHNKAWVDSYCTPYKQNTNGPVRCKYFDTHTPGPDDDLECINSYSYLRHEFEQARRRGKKIVVLYNSTRKEASWLPSYLKPYANEAIPFWIYNANGVKIGNYHLVKGVLGFA